MKILILFLSIVFSFSYNLIVMNKIDSNKLNNIGFVCSKKNSVYECLSSSNINELKRIKDFLRNKFNINSKIVNNTVSVLKKNKEINSSKKQVKNIKNLKTKYCIQAASFKYLSNAKTLFKLYKKYPFVRIEKIGNFYTLRIGEGSYKDIKVLKKEIKKGVIKKCDLIPERISIANFNINDIEKSNNDFNKSLVNNSAKKVIANNQKTLKQMYNYLKSGDLVNAKKLALKLKNIYPDDVKLVYGLLSMKKGNFKNACQIFSSLHTNNAQKLKQNACYTYDMKEGFKIINSAPKKALSLFNEALKYKENDKDALLGKGDSYINLKKYKKAYKVLKNLYQKYPKNKNILEKYIKVLYLSKKFDELQKLQAIFPDEFKNKFSDIDFYIDLKKAQQFLNQKKYNKSENILITLYSQKPDDINILSLLADLYLQTNQLDKSSNFFQNVLVISPDNIHALKGLEFIYMKKGDYKKALMYSDKITSLGFNDKNKEKIRKFYYINLAKHYLKENKIKKAKDISKKAYDLDKKDALVLALLGDIAFKENKNNLAYLYYAKAYATASNDFDIKSKFLYILLKLNLFDQIKIILSKVDMSSLNNKQKSLLKKFYINLYSQYSIYLLNNKEYINALNAVNKGLLIDDNNYSLLSTKAWICLKLKKYKCSKKYFKLALSKKEDNELKYGLALVNLNLGNKRIATNILNSIKTNDKNLKIKIAGAYVRMGDIKKAKSLLKGMNKLSIPVEKK